MLAIADSFWTTTLPLFTASLIMLAAMYQRRQEMRRLLEAQAIIPAKRN